MFYYSLLMLFDRKVYKTDKIEAEHKWTDRCNNIMLKYKDFGHEEGYNSGY